MNTDTMRRVLELVADERHRQYLKWGVQNPPGIHPDALDWRDSCATETNVADFYRIPTAENAKDRTNRGIANGDYTWADILIEEVSEAIEAATVHHLASQYAWEGGSRFRSELRKELVQVAAVAVQWIEMLED